MRAIDRIEIRYFRSFSDRTLIDDLTDINVFSGSNDAGKSNVLRALNLFFNDQVSNGIPFDIDRDLNKLHKIRSKEKADKKRASKEEARQRDLLVKIKVHFTREDSGGCFAKAIFR